MIELARQRDVTMIEIDGSHGEGGGQIVRTALTLAAVTGQSCRIVNIRAGRSRPGLLRQHLTAVNALAEICDARTEGAQLGSQSVTFTPSRPRGGDYVFQVGTAGSATLVAQTVLPLLLIAEQPSTLCVSGGTHNAWAPPFDYLDRVFLPLLRRIGARVDAMLDCYGFFPAGGGQFRMSVQPAAAWHGLQLTTPSLAQPVGVTAIVSGIPESIGRRECKTIERKTGWPPSLFLVKSVQQAHGPGNVVMIELRNGDVAEIVTGFGQVGVRAEQVARETLREARQYLAARVPIGPYLADQLMLPLSLAAIRGGGPSEFLTMPLTRHSQTQRFVIERFLEVRISVHSSAAGCVVEIA